MTVHSIRHFTIYKFFLYGTRIKKNQSTLAYYGIILLTWMLCSLWYQQKCIAEWFGIASRIVTCTMHHVLYVISEVMPVSLFNSECVLSYACLKSSICLYKNLFGFVFLQIVWLYKPFIAVNSSRLSIQLTRFTFTDLWNLKNNCIKRWVEVVWCCVVVDV